MWHGESTRNGMTASCRSSVIESGEQLENVADKTVVFEFDTIVAEIDRAQHVRSTLSNTLSSTMGVDSMIRNLLRAKAATNFIYVKLPADVPNPYEQSCVIRKKTCVRHIKSTGRHHTQNRSSPAQPPKSSPSDSVGGQNRSWTAYNKPAVNQTSRSGSS